MNRKDFLDATASVLNDRGAVYGSPERSFNKIAMGWSALMEREITSADVALMMAWLKIVRASEAPGHYDSFVDLAGYAACAAECAIDWSDEATLVLK